MRSALAGFVARVRPLRTFAVMLADRVTSRQIGRVDHMERDDERYPATVEGSVRLIDSYRFVNPQVRALGVPAASNSGATSPIAAHARLVLIAARGNHSHRALTQVRRISPRGTA